MRIRYKFKNRLGMLKGTEEIQKKKEKKIKKIKGMEKVKEIKKRKEEWRKSEKNYLE